MEKLSHTFKLPAKLRVLPLVFFLIISFSCEKINYRWVYYDETYCADAWTSTTNNETLKSNITLHFKEQNITIYDIEIFNDREPEPYNGCGNKSGRRIKCKVKKKHLDEMKAKGFYE